jgi:hypothetical protein
VALTHAEIQHVESWLKLHLGLMAPQNDRGTQKAEEK